MQNKDLSLTKVEDEVQPLIIEDMGIVYKDQSQTKTKRVGCKQHERRVTKATKTFGEKEIM